MNNKINKFKDYLQVTMLFSILELDGWISLKKTGLIKDLYININQIKILNKQFWKILIPMEIQIFRLRP